MSKADMGALSKDEDKSPLGSFSNCPLCHGAKFVYPKTSSGKIDYTRIVICRCTDTIADEKLKKLLNYSGLGTLRGISFDTLIPKEGLHNQDLINSYKEVLSVAYAFSQKPEGFLIITGPSGTGKTHIAAAVTNKLVEAGRVVLYRSAPDLMDEFRGRFLNDAESSHPDAFEQIKKCPVLVLDDIGIQSDTNWTREKLDQLLTYRRHQQLPTVLILAISMNNLDDRLKHRIIGFSDSKILRLRDRENTDLSWPTSLQLQMGMNFDNFDHDRINLPIEERENLSRAYKVAYDFALSPEGWLILQGDTGCGKTHLASSIVNHRYKEGKPAYFVVVPEFLDHLRSTFSPDSKVTYDEVFDRVKTTQFLVLDDFGEQATTSWAQEKLYQVISYRYNAQLPTVITSRASLEEIDPAISSRFIDHKFSLVFNIIAPDYRGDAKHSTNNKSKSSRNNYGKK